MVVAGVSDAAGVWVCVATAPREFAAGTMPPAGAWPLPPPPQAVKAASKKVAADRRLKEKNEDACAILYTCQYRNCSLKRQACCYASYHNHCRNGRVENPQASGGWKDFSKVATRFCNVQIFAGMDSALPRTRTRIAHTQYAKNRERKTADGRAEVTRREGGSFRRPP
jgi:hypothetical protein